MRTLKVLWGMLRLVKVTWKNERHMMKTLTPQQLHERQYIRCVQQMWVWDQKNNNRQVMRFATFAIKEGRWLLQYADSIEDYEYTLPVVPHQPRLDPVVQEALDRYLEDVKVNIKR